MRFLAGLLVSTWLSSCVTAPAPPATEGAFIAPGVFFATPGPRELGYSVAAVQLVTASYRGERLVFEAHISASPRSVDLVSIDGLGRRAVTATRTQDKLTSEIADWVPTQLRASNILGDLAIIYWPEQAVRDGLEGSTAILVARDGERSILVEGREIIRVDYDGTAAADPWVGKTRFRNEAFGYSLELRSTRVAQ